MAYRWDWDEETLYTSGDRYFADVLAAIDAARSSIEIESYIFVKGTLGDRLVAGLSRAVQRGVKVRMIIDGWGSPNFMRDYWPELSSAGVKIRFFRVLPVILTKLPGDPDGFFRRILYRWSRMNRGNHRKFILIDKSLLFAGSFNVSDVHLTEVSGKEAWKDMGIRVRGPEVRHASRAFERAYKGWKALNWPAINPKLLLLNDTLLHKRSARSRHIQQLKRARSRIWLATPYFVPIGSIYRLLVRQAKAGVDVRLMIPDKNDVFFMNWISLPLLRDLVKSGVKVFVFKPIFAHQKIFIADDWMCVGSTNLNHRSFLHDLEMDVVLTSETNKDLLEKTYLDDQQSSEPFDRSDWANLPMWQRFLASFFVLLKYWA